MTDHILPVGEYYADVRKKDTVFIHHTAGSHRPDWTIDGWKLDGTKTGSRLAVATAYVIGGISTTDGDATYDGEIYRAFDEKYWAHHLGVKQQNNRLLNQKSIAIELCNYGPLIRTDSGVYLNYVKKPVAEQYVTTLDKPFRGFKYYHRYTDKQLASLSILLKEISGRHSIDLTSGIRTLLPDSPNTAFDINTDALAGVPGLWTHCNVRRDKTDCYPQQELINLILTL